MCRIKFLILNILLLCLLISQINSQGLPDIPRHEVLIVDNHKGRIIDPYDFNYWKPGNIEEGGGLHQLLLDALWYLDPQTGKVINSLAESSPSYDKDYKKLTIKLRKGIYWSDGKPFTADDVVFTINYHIKNTGLTYSEFFIRNVSKAYKLDDYTVVVEFKNPMPSFHHIFSSLVYNTCYIMPKHKFEREKDPLKYKFYFPISLGPYILKSFDINGYWRLFERRQDWQRTSVGQIYGMPTPKYILFIYYGIDEKKIMAQSRHELDLIFDLTPEAWEVLRKSNKYSRVWYKDFPWAWMDDVRARAIGFNLEKYPYNIKDVRWALALAIDLTEVVISGFKGIFRINPLAICANNILINEYYLPLEKWLSDFKLEGDFAPWDSQISYKLEEYLKKIGYVYEGDIRNLFGIGWWKYAPDVAEKLLLKQGFRRDKNGKWLLPNGKPWVINIISPSFNEVQGMRLAFSVAEQWKKFGIDVNVETYDSLIYVVKISSGDFEVCSHWTIPSFDIYFAIQQYHSSYYKPSGKLAFSQNFIRWKNKKIDNIIEKMITIPPEDEKAKELIMEFIKIYVEEMPSIVFTTTFKFCAQDNYYWTNFPNSENPYMAPVWWWGLFKFMLPFINSTGRK